MRRAFRAATVAGWKKKGARHAGPGLGRGARLTEREGAPPDMGMGIVIRALLALGGAVAAVLVARDSPNFGVVQGMMALVAAVAFLIAGGLIGRR